MLNAQQGKTSNIKQYTTASVQRRYSVSTASVQCRYSVSTELVQRQYSEVSVEWSVSTV